jgi:hypothetical protein
MFHVWLSGTTGLVSRNLFVCIAEYLPVRDLAVLKTITESITVMDTSALVGVDRLLTSAEHKGTQHDFDLIDAMSLLTLSTDQKQMWQETNEKQSPVMTSIKIHRSRHLYYSYLIKLLLLADLK